MSLLIEYAGMSWNELPVHSSSEEDINTTSQIVEASGNESQNSSCCSSPLPTDDVTKLPLKDMKTFGYCPVQDDFMMVECDLCGLVLKLESLSSHIENRHGTSKFKKPSPPTQPKVVHVVQAKHKTTSRRKNGSRPTQPSSVEAVKQSPASGSRGAVSVSRNCPPNREDWLHFTYGHPIPLAICTLGVRRIGGLTFPDRNRVVTRKMARMRITNIVQGNFRPVDTFVKHFTLQQVQGAITI